MVCAARHPKKVREHELRKVVEHLRSWPCSVQRRKVMRSKVAAAGGRLHTTTVNHVYHLGSGRMEAAEEGGGRGLSGEGEVTGANDGKGRKCTRSNQTPGKPRGSSKLRQDASVRIRNPRT
eukprot:6185652-Pleurochrysis_carterae.AAC.1